MKKGKIKTDKEDKDFKSEREHWVRVIDFKVWEILKILEDGPKYVREFKKAGFVGSYTDLSGNLHTLQELGFVEMEHERNSHRDYYSLTSNGRWLLSTFDQIGERVKKLRESK